MLPMQRLAPVHPPSSGRGTKRHHTTISVLSNLSQMAVAGEKFEFQQMDFHVSNRVKPSVVRLRGNELGNASGIMTGRGLQGCDLSQQMRFFHVERKRSPSHRAQIGQRPVGTILTAWQKSHVENRPASFCPVPGRAFLNDLVGWSDGTMGFHPVPREALRFNDYPQL